LALLRTGEREGAVTAARDGAVVVSVNVGAPRALRWRDQEVTTAIWKAPAAGRLAVRGVNVDGDNQADRSVHGGPDKAVYAYAAEDYAWWSERVGRDLGPGTFGDNLTTGGMDVSGAVVGERWRAGGVLFEVAQPRIPCFKLGIRMGDQRFVRRFGLAGRPGAYLRVVAEGELGAGDPIELVHQPDHGLTVGDVARAYHADRSLVPRLLEVPELPVRWRDWARQRLARAAAPSPRRRA
jgi:MOSC domain-containing protein YiiM